MQQSLNASPDARNCRGRKIISRDDGRGTRSQRPRGVRPEIEQQFERGSELCPCVDGRCCPGLSGREDKGSRRALSEMHCEDFLISLPRRNSWRSCTREILLTKAEAYDLASKARKSLPTDPAVAQMLGQLSYEKKGLFTRFAASAGECEEKTARCGRALLPWTFLQGSKTAGRSKKSADGRAGRWFVIAIRRCCSAHSG